MKFNNSKPTESATKAVVGAAALGAGILIVEDHPTMREGLIRVIERENDLRVAGQADSAVRALEFLAASEPALVLLDISLGDDNGIELIKDIKIRHPQLPVLVHSMHEDSVYAGRALRAGAKGYVAKSEPPENLLKAIREVLRGEIYLNEVLTKQILHTLAADEHQNGASPFGVLSDREFEVFEMIGKGFVTKEIAATLHLSQKTVQAHRDHIREKMGFKDAASLLRFSIRWTEAQG
jgi:DNA-binding NarL/FixJ family response regulator